MNKKRLSALVLGLVAIQGLVPSYYASEESKLSEGQTPVVYAPTEPTAKQVRIAAPTDIVKFDDINLETYIAGGLGVEVGAVTVEDMSRVTVIDFPNQGLTDLTGIEYAVNAVQIDLYSNNVSDLTPLSGLTNLEILSINKNNVTDLTPISGLTNLTKFMASENKITDLSSLSRLTKLELVSAPFNEINNITGLASLPNLKQVFLQNNNISDISALTNSTKLTTLQLSSNHIDDYSPLQKIFDTGNIELMNLRNQTINLAPITVTNTDLIKYRVKAINDTTIVLVLGIPVVGEKIMTSTAANNEGVLEYSVTVTQTVTYNQINGDETANSGQGNPLTNDQLATLFNVNTANGNKPTVDQSAVNYAVPGTYDVIFSDDSGTLTVKLTIVDTKPLINLGNDTITIKLGETITDFIAAFGIEATEITNGDLTTAVLIDDSGVDYNKAGTYEVKLSVIDAEGNNAFSTGYVVIESEIIDPLPEETISEIKSEETTDITTSEETISEETTDTTTSEETTDITTSEETTVTTTSEETTDTTTSEETTDTATSEETTDTTASEDINSEQQITVVTNKAMTSGTNKSLSSTGNYNVIFLCGLTIISAIALTYKKMLLNK